MTSTNTVSRTAIVLACMAGGAVGRISVGVFEPLLLLIADWMPHFARDLIAGVASWVVTGVVGWLGFSRLVWWAGKLDAEWQRADDSQSGQGQ